MEPRINFINLAVKDLSKAIKFYTIGLNLKTTGIINAGLRDSATGATGTIAYFDLQCGLKLGLYERNNLAGDAGVADATPSSLEVSLGYSVGSKEEVTALLQQAKAAGATITSEAREKPWEVYSGYFKDPDGHLWEVSCQI